MSMARRDQGKQDEARDLLALVYGWFTGGFNTLDLKEAEALFDELSAWRAATSMRGCGADQGESDEARDLLAKALLDELNA